MFYSHNILTKKGKLGIIWLAATYKGQKSRYLNIKDFKKVNIIKACEYIINPTLPFALRLSSTLMVGVVRVYNEHTRIVLFEANEMMKAVQAAIAQQRISSELQMKTPELRQEVITLPLLLDYEIDLPECQERIHTDLLVTFAKSDKYFRLPHVKSPEPPLPSPGSSPEQKISTEEEKSPHQADRKDITIPEIDYNAILDEEIKIPGDIDIVEPLPLDDIDLLGEPGDRKVEDYGVSPLKATEVPGEEADVMLFDEQTGVLKPETTPTEETHIPHRLATPLQAGIEALQPVRPRRKRKLAVDFNIVLTGGAMRKNFDNVDSLKRRKICHIPQPQSLRELFTSPATSVAREAPFRHLWEANAKVPFADEAHWMLDVSTATHTSPIPSILEELSSGLDESPSIEVLRAASHASMDFEQSAGMDTTPEVSTLAEKSRRSRDLSLSGDRRIDVSIGTPGKTSSRLSAADRQSFLSPIADRDEESMDIALPLEDIAEHVSMEESDRIAVDRTHETLRTIKHAMGDDISVPFSFLVPYNTLRKHAASLFCSVIALTNIGVLVLKQRYPYEEIVIGRGREY